MHASVDADNEERAIAQAARILSLDHDGTGYATWVSATRSSGSSSAPAATCARCSSTRPTRPRRGPSSRRARATGRRSSCARRSPATALSAPPSCFAARAARAAGGQAAATARGRRGGAGGKAGSRGTAGRGARGGARAASRSSPASARSTPALILLRAVGTTDVLDGGRAAAKKAVEQRYGEPLEPLRRGLAAVPDVGLGADASHGCLSSTSSATSRPASRRCT